MRMSLNASLLGTSVALASFTIPGFGAAQEAAIQTATAFTTSEDTATGEDRAEAELAAAAARAEADDFTPMTDSERFKNYLTGTFGYAALEKAAVTAEMKQLKGRPIEWGKSPSKYGVRLGSAFAQHFIRGTLQYGVSSALHEDNRYQRSGKKGFWKRTGYAISSTFLARRPDGRRRFSVSRIGSAGGASFISRAWLPGSVATVGAGASSFGLTIAFDVGSHIFREFWPDLKRHFGRH
jgi:hypothetical protein